MTESWRFARWRLRCRIALTLFYGLAGLLHNLIPKPFVSITPVWVPYPDAVILLTGICELLGAAGLWNRPLARAAAIGLALYALCVYPANIKHAIDSLSSTDATILPWFYHAPRLAAQPLLVWLPLFAVGLVTWPFSRMGREPNAEKRVE